MLRSNIREIFAQELAAKFFLSLKNHPLFNDWDTTSLMALSKTIISFKKGDIDFYLDNNKYTPKDILKAINEIIELILIPEIEKVIL